MEFLRDALGGEEPFTLEIDIDPTGTTGEYNLISVVGDWIQVSLVRMPGRVFWMNGRRLFRVAVSYG